ncbi:carbohydrate-binding module family 35 protein [Neolentinus lepideus HHB14362 ss-1]|uniref:Alpha-galactosidase n=1 Tax=Neolentinus lepideus HHB14362 ss-1 TaxID=1314782 RepID=A0A165MPL7_9AGAM|nr:carbohydrate-binding module family 35 protein [Neolentinus lepideus HHB14362 ss-1]
MQFPALLFLAGSLFTAAHALQNGLAIKPPMGWNPYNVFLCDTTEDQYHTAAQALIKSGLSSLGYQYFNLDCGWQGTNRTENGTFTWDATRIPSGVPALASYVHGLGLKFGVYSDAGYYSCDFVGGSAHWLGSLGHEKADAAAFTSWGADYLKYDNCYSVNSTDFVDYNPPFSLEPHYTAMRDALNSTSRPVVYSVCEWGVQDPARWATSVGNSWRISNDVGPPNSWANIVRIINQVVPVTGFAGPGAWNDLDLLEVGNTGLSVAEQQSHFAFWAAVKSPLLISTNLSNAAQSTLDILGNTRIIGLNQDSLGKSISFKRRYTNDYDVWSGPLADGSTVALLLNWQNQTRPLTFDLSDVSFKSATAIDLWSGESLGKVVDSYNTTLDGHASLVLRLSDTISLPSPSFTYYPASSTNTTLSGGAASRSVNSTITVVGGIGYNGSLTFTGIDGGSSGGSKLVSIDYINADFTYQNTDCSNCRNAYISVNGGPAQQMQMPISGQSWDILFSGYLVGLSDFRPGRNNTIQFANPNAWAPDILRIGVRLS